MQFVTLQVKLCQHFAVSPKTTINFFYLPGSFYSDVRPVLASQSVQSTGWDCQIASVQQHSSVRKHISSLSVIRPGTRALISCCVFRLMRPCCSRAEINPFFLSVLKLDFFEIPKTQKASTPNASALSLASAPPQPYSPRIEGGWKEWSAAFAWRWWTQFKKSLNLWILPVSWSFGFIIILFVPVFKCQTQDATKSRATGGTSVSLLFYSLTGDIRSLHFTHQRLVNAHTAKHALQAEGVWGFELCLITLCS